MSEPTDSSRDDGACAVPGCARAARVALRGADGVLALCLEHPGRAPALVRARAGGPGECVACDAPRPDTLEVTTDGLRARLCRGHVVALLTHSLTDVAWERLVGEAGGGAERVALLSSRY